MMVVTDDVDEWWMVIFVLLGMCKYLHHDLCRGNIKVLRLSIVCYSDLKPQHHEIQMDILYTVICTFPKLPTMRIWQQYKSSFEEEFSYF